MLGASEELAGIQLGDARLHARLRYSCDLLSRAPEASIPEVAQDSASTKGIYRLLSNRRVKSDAILSAHSEKTLARCVGEREVLCIGDTTDVNVSRDCPAAGTGGMSEKSMRGFYAHVLLAITPDCRHLGVLQNTWLVRDPKKMGKKAKAARQFPLHEKETVRWLDNFTYVNKLALAQPDTNFYYIADRESDFFELLDFAKDATAHLIIRSRSNRLLDTGKKAHDVIAQAPIIGHVIVTIPRTRQRKERSATLALRAQSLPLRAPKRPGGRGASVTIHAIEAREINAPTGVDPVSWILYTFCPIDTKEQLFAILKRYVCRWQIEIYFRVLKEYCQIEDLRLDHIDRLQNAIAIYMIISWHVMHLMTTARQYPDLPCNDIFEQHEWKLAWILWYKKPPPKKTPTNREIVRLIAQLGGFQARKGDGEPGAKTIWRGLEKLHIMIDASEALQCMASKGGDVGNG